MPPRLANWLPFVLILLASCQRSANPDDPTYDGKPLSTWLKEMEDPDPVKRSKAAWALGDLRPKNPRGVPALVLALKDKNAGVRIMSAQSLKWLGPVAKEATPALISCLDDNNDGVAAEAAAALGEIGPDAGAAVPALIELLKRNGEPRSQAAIALGQIGPTAKTATPALIAVLEAKEPTGRSSAAFALGKIGPDAKAAVPALMTAVKEQSTRSAAIKALGEVGPEAKAAVPQLIEQMKDRQKDDELNWITAARALANIEPEAARPAVPDLIEAVRSTRSSPPGNVRARDLYRAASEALKAIDKTAAAREGVR